MNALDMSVERKLAHAGVLASNIRLDGVVGYLNTLFRRHLGRSMFKTGSRFKDVYSAVFATEDAARTAMAWADDVLSEIRVVPLKSGVVLTGIIGWVP